MINPQWLELPMSRTNSYGPQDVRANEVRLYMHVERERERERERWGNYVYLFYDYDDTSKSFHKMLGIRLVYNASFFVKASTLTSQRKIALDQSMAFWSSDKY